MHYAEAISCGLLVLQSETSRTFALFILHISSCPALELALLLALTSVYDACHSLRLAL